MTMLPIDWSQPEAGVQMSPLKQSIKVNLLVLPFPGHRAWWGSMEYRDENGIGQHNTTLDPSVVVELSNSLTQTYFYPLIFHPGFNT